MNITGKLHAKFDTQQISDKFRKREFVVLYADNPDYPQYIKFELTQDRCEQLDQYEVGSELDVSFNLKGREWKKSPTESVYFTSLEAWRLQQADGSGSGAPLPEEPNDFALVTNEDPNDLPF